MSEVESRTQPLRPRPRTQENPKPRMNQEQLLSRPRTDMVEVNDQGHNFFSILVGKFSLNFECENAQYNAFRKKFDDNLKIRGFKMT